jgi:hypothetical protein
MDRSVNAWYFGVASLCFRGRFTQICIMCRTPPVRANVSSWNSLCRMAGSRRHPLDLPGPMIPPLPALSRWAIAPS